MDVNRWSSRWQGGRAEQVATATRPGERAQDASASSAEGRGVPAAGWYDDPERPDALRWWNGSTWSDQRMARPPATPAPGPVPPAATSEDGSDALGAAPGPEPVPASAHVDAPVAAEQRPPLPTEEIRGWASGAEEAVARAWSVGSSEAWEDAARIATVMAATAKSIAVATDAQRRAELARDEATAALQEVRGLIQQARHARRLAKNIRCVVDAARAANTPAAWRAAVDRIESMNGGG